MARDRRRIIAATAIGATFGGAPSTLHALVAGRSVRSAAGDVYDATCAIGTLVPPGRREFRRGAAVHVGISIVCAEALARTLPPRRSVAWGAAAGLAIGVINVGAIGRLFPAIRALPLVPQLADNVMFGVLVALVLDYQPG